MAIKCTFFTFTRHAVMQMFEREISVDDVKKVVTEGEIIQSYPNDKPYPSVLILGFINKRPIHTVVASEQTLGECIIVTAYQPSAKVWEDDFKKRIKYE
ncbi:MAG: DUF4258 domain-containing protein [Balneolaceae bacterium]|nr:DUF4258 domain-containing protein [Balneolaceae bacterium]